MYICIDCGYSFTEAEKITERHGLSAPPYETINVCPACKSENYRKQNHDYCRYCGTKLKNGAIDYCSISCRRRGQNAWLKQKRRKKQLADSDIYKIIRKIDAYNRRNKTKYSYGQYTALVEGRKKQ